MVESDYSGLKSKKYCNPNHSANIEVLCTQDGTLCCADCAGNHSEHFENIKDIKSIFESKLPPYRQLITEIKIISKMQISPDELRSYVSQLLESAFDQMINRVADMKAQWIEENFDRIMDSLEPNISDLPTLSNELEESFKKIHTFINATETNFEEVMKLKQPEEFGSQIQEILKASNIRRKYKDLKVNLHFKEESIKKMFKFIPIYEGSVFNQKDLGFALSLLPPLKGLKMLFSGKRDGFGATAFHKKCDGVEDTIILIKSTNGHYFGGFAKPPWHSNGSFTRDDSKSSFLFTCRNKAKHTLIDPQNPIYGRGDYGPTFGCSRFPDFLIHSNNKCQNDLGNSYSIPKGMKKEDYLCGHNNTEIEDYEVHQVIFHKYKQIQQGIRY